MGIMRKKVNWVLDADIRDFFGSISHEWMVKFLQHRIADQRILRLIKKWLRAGVSEDGEWSKTEVGTPQGSVISPLLGNVYLHYAFDLWVQHWRKHRATGEVIVVRYADKSLKISLLVYGFVFVLGEAYLMVLFADLKWPRILVFLAIASWGVLLGSGMWYRHQRRARDSDVAQK